MCRLPQSGLLIVDWKAVTSESDDYATQLYLYALTALRCGRWSDIAPQNIVLCEANLLQNVVREYPVTLEQLTTVEDFAYSSILEMQLLTEGISKDDFQIGDYEVAEKATTCALCAFRSPCREANASENLVSLTTLTRTPKSSGQNRKRGGTVNTEKMRVSTPALWDEEAGR
jgi:hypothetical protein